MYFRLILLSFNWSQCILVLCFRGFYWWFNCVAENAQCSHYSVSLRRHGKKMSVKMCCHHVSYVISNWSEENSLVHNRTKDKVLERASIAITEVQNIGRVSTFILIYSTYSTALFFSSSLAFWKRKVQRSKACLRSSAPALELTAVKVHVIKWNGSICMEALGTNFLKFFRVQITAYQVALLNSEHGNPRTSNNLLNIKHIAGLFYHSPRKFA